MSEKESFIQKITQWKVILGIQIIASLLFIGLILKLGALPLAYAMGVVVFLMLIGMAMFFMMKPSREEGHGKVRTIVGKLLSIVLSLVISLGSLYVAQGNSFIDGISDADSEVTRMSVVVLQESGYQELADLKNKKIEVNTSVETAKMNEAIAAVKKVESSIQFEEKTEFTKMANDLYEKKTDAILVNEAYFAIFEANHKDFENETRVIYTYEIVEKTKDISKGINVTEDPFVVYISGIDTYGKVSTVSRSDVNMLVTVHPKTKQILMTSFPRDYYVTLDNKQQKDKLTHAGLGGIENSVKTIENFMGVDVNYYARVNFTSLIKIVDALGGITVDSVESFTTKASKTSRSYSFKKGENKMNGAQALAFSRERYHVTGGDNGRIANQQRVLTAIIEKMISPSIIMNYTSVLNSISGSFETNMKSSDIKSLLQMQIDDQASWNITKKQLEGTGKTMTGGAYAPNSRLYYMLPNEESIAENKQAIQSILSGASE